MSKEQEHILGAFGDAISKLRDDVLIMGDLSERGLDNAFKGLSLRDTDLCNLAIADDEEIDEMEKRLDMEGQDLMVRFHPVASDLREVISAMKISVNLERIGDQAVTIARRGRKLNREEPVNLGESLQPVYLAARKMLDDALRAYAERNVELAHEIIRHDRLLDDQCSEFDSKISDELSDKGVHVPSYINLLFVSRSLERVGDHASNIAEDVIYLANASDVRHSALG